MGIDPVGVDENNVHSHNRYAYANNNPYKFVDPDGRVAFFALLWPALQVLGVGVTSYETTTVVLNVANGNQTLGQAARKEAPGIAIGLVTGVAGRVGGKLVKNVDFVDGYRAVSKAEADDIATHGFRPNPSGRSMDDKWFSETRAGAEKFKNQYPDLTETVKAKVPKEVYERSYKVPNIDNTGPGFCVQYGDLPSIRK